MFIPVLFGIVVTILLLATFTMEMLVALSLVYLALIPVSIRRYRAFQRADAAAGSASAPEEAGGSASPERRRHGERRGQEDAIPVTIGARPWGDHRDGQRPGRSVLHHRQSAERFGATISCILQVGYCSQTHGSQLGSARFEKRHQARENQDRIICRRKNYSNFLGR